MSHAAFFDESFVKGCRRVPDEVVAAAYETTPAEDRARIKEELAFAAIWADVASSGTPSSIWPSAPTAAWEEKGEERILRLRSGFGLLRRRAPAPWAVFLLGGAPISPVRLAAAIMAAHLAGVSHLAALCFGSRDPEETMPPLIWATLDISGVGDLFVLTTDADPIETALRLGPALLPDDPPESQPDPPAPFRRNLAFRDYPLFPERSMREEPGRLLLFGAPDALTPQQLRPNIWLDRPPRRVLAPVRTTLDEDRLRWAHPEISTIIYARPANRDVDLSFNPLEAVQTGVLNLEPGMEHLWIDLSPTFFRNETRTFFRM